MSMPGFAAEVSFYKSVNNYSMRGAFGQYGKMVDNGVWHDY